MLIPLYWAEARLQERVRGRQVTLRRFGWSDLSANLAQLHAEERVHEAMAQVIAGKALAKRDLKRTYGGAFGLPIREEVISKHGAAVITRNSYGALCLNTPNVLFADIDFPSGRDARLENALSLLVVVATVSAAYFARSWWVTLAAFLSALFLRWLLSFSLHALRRKIHGSPEAQALARVDVQARLRPAWRMNIYRTPAGLRVLVLHASFDPADPEVHAFLQAIHSDPAYMHMVRLQHCFRARLTPKPWRIKLERIPAGRMVWPYRERWFELRRQWIAKYTEKSRGYAACRLLLEVGTGPLDQDAEAVRQVHDHYCQIGTNLPLA